MNKTGKILLALAVVVIVAAGAILIASMYRQPTNNIDNETQNTTTTSDQPAEEPAATPVVTITYDGTSFTLSADTIKAGETVKVVNNSSKELEFDSDPHPVHTDNPELNAGPIAAGESRSFVLNTKGTWGFHNHLNASQHGSLTVE